MDPILTPILASVGVAALGGYAGRKQQQRQLTVDAIGQQGQEMQAELEQERQKKSGSLNDLIEAYRSALG